MDINSEAAHAGGTLAIVPLQGGAILLISAGTGEWQQLSTPTPASSAPTWSADGTSLFFIAVGSGVSDIYRMGIGASGDVTSTAERLTTGLLVQSLALTSTQIAYSVRMSGADIWSVPITSTPTDLTRAELVTAGDRAVGAMIAERSRKALLFTDDAPDGGVFEVTVDGRRSKHLVSPLPATARLFGLPPDTSLASAFTRFRTPSPDRQQVADVQLVPGGRRPQILIVRRDRQASWGPPQELPDGGGWPVSWSPDSRFIVYAKHGGVEMYWPETRMHRRIYEPSVQNPWVTAVTVSNTGTQLALKRGEAGAGRASFWQLPISSRGACSEGADEKTDLVDRHHPARDLDDRVPGSTGCALVCRGCDRGRRILAHGDWRERGTACLPHQRRREVTSGRSGASTRGRLPRRRW